MEEGEMTGQRHYDSSSLAGVIVTDLFRDTDAWATREDAAWPIPTTDLSSASLEYEDRKARLEALIIRMITEAPSWDGKPTRISVQTALTAIRFLKVLPPDRELPKVAPDGEGDLLFVWEPPNGNCIVTVEGNLLHMVDQPGTQHVQHVDLKEFVSRRIPVSILHAIPFK
jgi:hypothetical protein